MSPMSRSSWNTSGASRSRPVRTEPAISQGTRVALWNVMRTRVPAGAVITPYYDSLLVKVTAWGHTPDEAASRMDRALREFRVRGLATNLQFLENVIAHPLFRSGECTTRFIDTTPELFHFQKRRDRATRLIRFLGPGEIVLLTGDGFKELKNGSQ